VTNFSIIPYLCFSFGKDLKNDRPWPGGEETKWTLYLFEDHGFIPFLIRCVDPSRRQLPICSGSEQAIWFPQEKSHHEQAEPSRIRKSAWRAKKQSKESRWPVCWWSHIEPYFLWKSENCENPWRIWYFVRINRDKDIPIRIFENFRPNLPTPPGTFRPLFWTLRPLLEPSDSECPAFAEWQNIATSDRATSRWQERTHTQNYLRGCQLLDNKTRSQNAVENNQLLDNYICWHYSVAFSLF